MNRTRWVLTLAIGVIAAGAHVPAEPENVGRIERLDPRFDALVAPGSALEKVADGIEWAEGPLWDARDGSLLFSDVPRNLMWDELAASESLRAARASGEDLVESVVPMLDGAR